jgi:hypothetical protein
MDPMKHDDDPTTFEGRFPQLEELVRWGGLPGVTYLLAAGENMGKLQRGEIPVMCGGKDYSGSWSMVREIPVLTVKGPKGESDMMLMAQGAPIRGADVTNGRRVCIVDPVLVDKTGIGGSDGKGKSGDDKQEGQGRPEAEFDAAQREVMARVKERQGRAAKQSPQK